MKNISIQYIATKTDKGNAESKIVSTLHQYCQLQNIDLLPFDRKLSSDIFLIIEPVKIGKDMFALSTVWKPWLMEHHPGVRLIFAGFSIGTHKNYLNLLDLPDDLNAWLGQLLTVGDYALQYAGVEERNGHKYDIFLDPWNRFLPLTGRDMRKQMEKFTEGHDRANSFYQQISRFRKILVDIRYLMEAEISKGEEKEIKKEVKLLREQARKEWDYLNIRWKYYRPFFSVMPFYETFDKIEENMTALENTIHHLKKLSYKPDITIIGNLRDLVKNELKRYIDYEDHW